MQEIGRKTEGPPEYAAVEWRQGYSVVHPDGRHEIGGQVKKVIITFEDDLSVTVEADGFKGKGCQDATRPYESDFGGATSRVAKPVMTATRDREVQR